MSEKLENLARIGSAVVGLGIAYLAHNGCNAEFTEDFSLTVRQTLEFGYIAAVYGVSSWYVGGDENAG